MTYQFTFIVFVGCSIAKISHERMQLMSRFHDNRKQDISAMLHLR